VRVGGICLFGKGNRGKLLWGALVGAAIDLISVASRSISINLGLGVVFLFFVVAAVLGFDFYGRP